MTKALDHLLDLLDLEQIEVNIFRGRSPNERLQRVFGGQVFTAEGQLVVSVMQEGLVRPGRELPWITRTAASGGRPNARVGHGWSRAARET